MEYIYEIVDATDDEMYYPIGAFEDLDFIKEMLTTACPSQAISDNADESETIEVRKRKVNEFGGQGACVFSIGRETVYVEDLDEYLWKTTILKDIESKEQHNAE